MKSKRGAIEISIGTIIIIVLGISMLILGLVLVNNIFFGDPEPLNYTFVLDGENMSSLMVCENYWHYEIDEGFIPCIVNRTVGGIGGATVDWSLSPQENCRLVDGEFVSSCSITRF